MAIFDLKVRIIPDMTQFKRDMQRGITGIGFPGGKKPSGKSAEVEVTGFGKMLGKLTGIFAILKSLDFLLTPILRLFDLILKAFFVPLLPLVTKILQFFTKKGGPLQAAFGAPQFEVTAEDSMFGAFVKGLANVGIRIGAFFIGIGKEMGQALFDKIIGPIEIFMIKLIFKIANSIDNAITAGMDLISQGFNFIKDGLKNIIDGIISFVNRIIPGTRFDIGRTSTTEVNQSFPITITGNTFQRESDLRSMADQISDALRKNLTLRTL